MTKGQKQKLTATVTPQNANITVTWKSSDNRIAVVDKNGNVTAIAPGKVTIFASAMGANGAVTDSITLTVDLVTHSVSEG